MVMNNSSDANGKAARSSPHVNAERVVVVPRQANGSFGIMLKEVSVTRRDVLDDGSTFEYPTTFFCVESSSTNERSSEIDLQSGDVLLAVNAERIASLEKDAIVRLIIGTPADEPLKLTVEHLRELDGRGSSSSSPTAINGDTTPTNRNKKTNLNGKASKENGQQEDEEDEEHVWVVHRHGFAAGRLLDRLGASRCRVQLEVTGETIDVASELVERRNSASIDRIENLARLRCLNESSLLNVARQRFAIQLFATWCGPHLLIVNPAGFAPADFSVPTTNSGGSANQSDVVNYSGRTAQLIRELTARASAQAPPHAFSVAERALRELLLTETTQSIVLLGASGSGKTTALRHLLHYFVHCYGHGRSPTISVQTIDAAFLLLNSFGGTRTISNTNASRYATLATLEFDPAPRLRGVHLQISLVERTRVARRGTGEPSFHILYQLISGADDELRSALLISKTAATPPTTRNRYVNALQRADDVHRARASWRRLEKAFESLNVSGDERRAVCVLLATIYHLGSLQFAPQADSASSYSITDRSGLTNAAKLLDCDESALESAIFRPNTTPADSLDAFVIGLFTEAFSLVVSFANRTLIGGGVTSSSIRQLHVLDVPGVTLAQEASTAQQRAVGFRELLINYANERVAQLFHDANFTTYEDRYAQEHVEPEVDLRRIAVSNPSTLVALLDRDRLVSAASLRKLARTRNDPASGSAVTADFEPEDVLKGLFWIIDDEASRSERQRAKALKSRGAIQSSDAGADEILLARVALVQRELLRQFVASAGGRATESASRSRYAELGFAAVAKLLKRVKGSNSRLVVQHMNAANAVIYDTVAWLREARESGGASSFDVAARLAALSRCAPLVSALAAYGTDQTLVADLLQRVKAAKPSLSAASRNVFRDWRGEPMEVDVQAVDPRVPGLRRAVQAVRNLSTSKRASLSAQAKLQLDTLLDLVAKSRMHFVVCLLPQTGAGLAEIRQQLLTTASGNTSTTDTDRLVNMPLLRVQLRSFQLLAATQYYRFGFPEAKPFREFRRLFEPYARAKAQTDVTDAVHKLLLAQAPFLGDDKQETQKIIDALRVDSAAYRLGTCQVFMRAGTLDGLLRSRDEFVSDLIVQVQARARGYLSRKHTERRRAEHEAVAVIQRNALSYLELRRWRWWRLYEVIRPLSVFRKREDEITQLKNALSQAEKDARDARSRSEQLDARCRQLESALNDENDETERLRESLARETSNRNNVRRQLDEALERADRLERRVRAYEIEDDASTLDGSLSLSTSLKDAARPALSSNEERALRDALARGEREQIAQAARDLVMSSSRATDGFSDASGGSPAPDGGENAAAEQVQVQADYREQCAQLTRGVDHLRKRLRDARSDFDDELAATRRLLDRRIKELEDERDEAQAEAQSVRDKLARCTTELRELRASNDETRATQLEMEREARRSDTDLSSLKQQLRAEREHRERLQREHTEILERSRQYELDAQTVRLELERANASSKVVPLASASTVSTPAVMANGTGSHRDHATKTPSEIEAIQSLIGEYEQRIKELESELDEEQVTLQRLEQAKVRLELGFEKQKQQFQRELADKELEKTDAQASAQKRIKQLEALIEEDQAEKQRLMRERRETERQIADLINQVPRRDRDGEKQRLTRELKRVRQQLKETEDQCEALRAQGDAAAKQFGRELKRQLEELEAEKEALIRARHALEAENDDLETRLADAARREGELRAKLDAAVAERSDLQSALEDREVELQYLTTRYKTIVQQTSIDQQTVAQLTKENMELLAEVEQLRSSVAEYQERVDLAQLEKIDKSELIKHEARLRDAENKLELEHSARVRSETLLERAREQIVALESAKQGAMDQLEIEAEKTRKQTKQLRDIRESNGELQHRFDDTERRKQDLQSRLDSLEQDYEQAQSDLRLAFRRISDLQALLDADDDDDADSNNGYESRSMERCQTLLNQVDNAIMQSKLRHTSLPNTRSGTNNPTPSGIGSPTVRSAAISGFAANSKRAQSPVSSRQTSHLTSRRSSTSSFTSNQ